MLAGGPPEDRSVVIRPTMIDLTVRLGRTSIFLCSLIQTSSSMLKYATVSYVFLSPSLFTAKTVRALSQANNRGYRHSPSTIGGDKEESANMSRTFIFVVRDNELLAAASVNERRSRWVARTGCQILEKSSEVE